MKVTPQFRLIGYKKKRRSYDFFSLRLVSHETSSGCTVTGGMQTAWSVPCSKLTVVRSETERASFSSCALEQHPPYPTPRSKVFSQKYETTGLIGESWRELSVNSWFWKTFRLVSRTAILAFLPAQSLGTGGGRDNLDDVCGAEQWKRGRFLGGQVVVQVLCGKKKKRQTVVVKPVIFSRQPV